MALLSELDLPTLDYTDPALRGPAFHPRMAQLREQSWLAATPLGAIVLDREAAELFLRSRSTTFPGRKLAEIFGIETGPLAEELRRNILCIDGDDHRRLRNLVNPSFTLRAADRFRAAMRTYLAELWDAVREQGACEFVEAFAKPCLGANLARAELQEALAFLAARIQRLELDGEPTYGSVTGIYGLDALPLRFTAA